MTETETQVAMQRLLMALAGALAGLAAWHFSEMADTMFNRPRLYLFTVTAVMSAFAILFGLLGPLRWPPAVASAVALAAVVAGLMTWASLRFDALEPFVESGLPILAMTLLLFIGTPFVSAALQRPGGALDYPLLFDTAWAILVRYLAAWLFTGVVWAIVWLSDSLLGIVGVTVIGDLLNIDPVPFALTGLFLGLAMAIMHELRDYVSPFLVLRLFRVILPVLVVVVAVFLLALPLRGVDRLFGNLSVAATLMVVAIAAITLVTSTLDRGTADEAQARIMRVSARAMCLMLPLLMAAAVWAVWLRVDAYGLTPPRLAAGLSAVLLLVYAILYAVAAVLPGWTRRIRQVNLAMALVVLCVAALWLSPVINAEALSTRSQVARFESGAVTPAQSALWEMKAVWGRPGARGLAQMRALAEADTHPRAEELRDALGHLDKAANRYDYERVLEDPPASLAEMEALLAQMAIFPEGQTVDAAELASLPLFIIEQLRESCPRADETGPGCVIILSDLNPFAPGEEGLLLQREGNVNGLNAVAISRDAGQLTPGRSLYSDAGGAPISDNHAALIDAMKTGDIAIVPSGMKMITLGGINVIP